VLTRRIIPCLDVRDGEVVKGVRFRDHVVMGAIEDLARRYRDAGADELVFYDITASPQQRAVDCAWVERVARIIDIPFCVAGGIRSVADARAVLHAGAAEFGAHLLHVVLRIMGNHNPAVVDGAAELVEGLRHRHAVLVEKFDGEAVRLLRAFAHEIIVHVGAHEHMHFALELEVLVDIDDSERCHAGLAWRVGRLIVCEKAGAFGVENGIAGVRVVHVCHHSLLSVEQVGGRGCGAGGGLNELARAQALQIGIPAGSLVAGLLVDHVARHRARIGVDQHLEHLALAFREGAQDVLAQRGAGWQWIEIGSEGLAAVGGLLDAIAVDVDHPALFEPLNVGVAG